MCEKKVRTSFRIDFPSLPMPRRTKSDRYICCVKCMVEVIFICRKSPYKLCCVERSDTQNISKIPLNHVLHEVASRYLMKTLIRINILFLFRRHELNNRTTFSIKCIPTIEIILKRKWDKHNVVRTFVINKDKEIYLVVFYTG